MASCALTREEIIDLIKAYELHIVSAVTGGGTTTLTRNDGGTFEFPTAAVTETDDNYIIEVGDDNIVIPKCYNKLYDCNGDRIDTCSQKLVTCADLESRRYLSTVSTDNSIDGNGTSGSPLSINAFTSNLLSGNGKQNNPLTINTDDLFSNACFPAPEEFDGCGTTKQVVFYEEEPNCWKLGILNTTATKLYSMTAGDGDVNQALGSDYLWPTNFNNYYSIEQLRADDTVNNVGDQGFIDENRIRNNVISGLSFTNECRKVYGLRNRILVNTGNVIATAFERRVCFSIRYRINQGPWIYERTNANGVQNTIATTSNYNGVSSVIEYEGTKVLPAGDIDIQLLAFTFNSTPATELVIAAYPRSDGRYNGPISVLTPEIT